MRDFRTVGESVEELNAAMEEASTYQMDRDSYSDGDWLGLLTPEICAERGIGEPAMNGETKRF